MAIRFIIVITRMPKKLQTAAIRIAARGEIDLVEIAVAIAFGASVHPLTKITPNVNIIVKKNAGFSIIYFRKSTKPISMLHFHFRFFYKNQPN